MSTLRACVIVPNWNGEDYIAECLTSLRKQSLRPHIIVVDNGSSDSSVERIKKDFPEVELLEFPDNAGFAGGVNRGIRPALEAGYEFIALFNNDAVAGKDWLKHLVQTAQAQPKAGIVTGKFMKMDKKHFDSTGDFYSTWGMPFPRGRNQIDRGQYNTAGPVFSATGGASLYRAKTLREIGLFDEDFFAYFEDVDISFRAQLAGWQVWYEPRAVAYHHVGRTSSRMGSLARYHSIKNCMLLYDKNMPGWLYWKYLPLFLAQLTRIQLGAIRDRQFGVFTKAFFAAARLSPSTFAKRQRIQAKRRVPLSYIDALLYHGRPKVKK